MSTIISITLKFKHNILLNKGTKITVTKEIDVTLNDFVTFPLVF